MQAVGMAGGEVVRCKIGARSLLDAITHHQAIFGGEETGGFVFPELTNIRRKSVRWQLKR